MIYQNQNAGCTVTVNKQSDENTVRIKPIFDPKKVRIEYTGPIIPEAVRKLVVYVNDADEYMQPRDITVTLQSPGGHLVALDYWVLNLDLWKERGISIKTNAGTQCASAAAMMLSLGSIGDRQCSLLTELLFHNPRLSLGNNAPLLEENAEEAYEQLKASRSRMHAMLKKHLVDNFGVLRFAKTLWQRSSWLQNQDINKISIANKYLSARDKNDIDLSTIESWAKSQPTTLDDASTMIKQWDKEVQDMFLRDKQIDQPIAWALMLIDSNEVLPVILEPDVAQWSETNALSPLFPSKSASAQRVRQ